MPPRWTLRQGAVAPNCAIVASVTGALTFGPKRSRAQEGGGSKGRLALSASGDHAPAHHLPDDFSASRMRTTLGPSRSSCCLHRIASTSDILTVTRRHARSISSSTDALTVTRSSRMVPRVLTFEPKDLRFTLPVRARWAEARECLPSSREPASRNPRTECMRTFDRLHALAHSFAFSPPVPGVRPCFELPSG